MIVIILTIIIIVIIGITKEKQETKNNMKVIELSYSSLTENIKKYNDIRTKYTDLLNNLFLEKYMDSHEEFTSLLTDYNKNIMSIDLAITNINLKCNHLYKDTNINKICNSYKPLYEKLINLYVTDMNNYNNTVTKYNEYKNDDIPLFEMIHKEYIDYNKDGIYEGREDNEENQNTE